MNYIDTCNKLLIYSNHPNILQVHSIVSHLVFSVVPKTIHFADITGGNKSIEFFITYISQ